MSASESVGCMKDVWSPNFAWLKNRIGQLAIGQPKDEDPAIIVHTASPLSTLQVRSLSFLKWHDSQKSCTGMHGSRCPSQLSERQWVLSAAPDMVLSIAVEAHASFSGPLPLPNLKAGCCGVFSNVGSKRTAFTLWKISFKKHG